MPLGIGPPSVRRCLPAQRQKLRRAPALLLPDPSISTSSSSAPAFPGSTPPITCRSAARARSYAILEARDAIGGTWDLFRYPGIRSDSDMYTLGFPFRPWTGREGDRRRGGDPRLCRGDGAGIRHRRADPLRPPGRSAPSWSSAEARWTVEVEADGEARRFTCALPVLVQRLLRLCGRATGPNGRARRTFAAASSIPSIWPDDLDHAGKRIVVIGSGATAVTLVPALAETAAHVTMLQRSPTYIVARPSRGPDRPLAAAPAAAQGRRQGDPLEERAARHLLLLARPQAAGAGQGGDPQAGRRAPAAGLRRRARFRASLQSLGPARSAWSPTATCSRRSTRARVSVVTDADRARSPRPGSASLRARSWRRTSSSPRPASIVKLLGGIALDVDGAPVNVADRLSYKGMMLSGVPNLALSFGYTNASWTLKCDLTSRYVCRLLRHMDRHGYAICVAAARRRRRRAPADARFQLGLCPPRRGQPAEPGAEGALAGPPELPQGPRRDALAPGDRRGDGVPQGRLTRDAAARHLTFT